MLPACQDYGVGVIPWSPLHGGLLGGIIRKTEQGKRRLTGRAKDGLKANKKAIKAYEDLCDEIGENPADVALAWLLAQPAVTAPIIGPRTMDQLDGAMKVAEGPADQGHAGPARRDLPRSRRRPPRRTPGSWLARVQSTTFGRRGIASAGVYA